MVKSAYPVTYKRFDCCAGGCRMYMDEPNDEPVRICPDCNTERYLDETNQRPAAYVNSTSIGSIIASKLSNPSTRMQMQYRARRPITSNNVPATDIFDGAFYKFLVGEHYFDNDDDVAIGLYIDGFNPFNASTFKATIVNMVIYNIAPNNRYGNQSFYITSKHIQY